MQPKMLPLSPMERKLQSDMIEERDARNQAIKSIEDQLKQIWHELKNPSSDRSWDVAMAAGASQGSEVTALRRDVVQLQQQLQQQMLNKAPQQMLNNAPPAASANDTSASTALATFGAPQEMEFMQNLVDEVHKDMDKMKREIAELQETLQLHTVKASRMALHCSELNAEERARAKEMLDKKEAEIRKKMEAPEKVAAAPAGRIADRTEGEEVSMERQRSQGSEQSRYNLPVSGSFSGVVTT